MYSTKVEKLSEFCTPAKYVNSPRCTQSYPPSSYPPPRVICWIGLAYVKAAKLYFYALQRKAQHPRSITYKPTLAVHSKIKLTAVLCLICASPRPLILRISENWVTLRAPRICAVRVIRGIVWLGRV